MSTIGLTRRLIVFLLTILFSATPTRTFARNSDDYRMYHQRIIEAETALAHQDYANALSIYQSVFDRYGFVFLRDCQVATQVALHLGRTEEAFVYLRRGIASGWTMKSIRKHSFLTAMRNHPDWTIVQRDYDSLQRVYLARLDPDLRNSVQRMFRRDQWKALRALFTIGSRGQERYAEKRFAPQSEQHVARLTELIRTRGYPGEWLVGNNFWASTILSHHNSISTRHTLNDTLYSHLKPLLWQAIGTGQMLPYELAIIDDWYSTIKSNGREKLYGYLNALTPAEVIRANQLRHQLGLRSVETRNQLIDVQQQTGMNLHLPGRPQLNGKIRIVQP